MSFTTSVFYLLFFLFHAIIAVKITNSTTGSVTTYILTQSTTGPIVDPAYIIAFVNTTTIVLLETDKDTASSFYLVGKSSSVIPITISPKGYPTSNNYLLECVDDNDGDVFKCIKDDIVVVRQNYRIPKLFHTITSTDLINSQGVMVRGGFGDDCSIPTVTWINIEFPSLNITTNGLCVDNFGVSFGGIYKSFYQDPLETRLINETRVFRRENTNRYQRFVIQRFDHDTNLKLVFSTADGSSVKPFNERLVSLSTVKADEFFESLPATFLFSDGCNITVELQESAEQDTWTLLELEGINDLNWYRNSLPTRFYVTQVCNYHIGRLDKNSLLVYPFTIEGEIGGGRPSFKTGGLFGSPIEILPNIQFQDYPLDCDVFWPQGVSFVGFGLTGEDGTVEYAPYNAANQLCYSPFLFVNEIKNLEALLPNGRELDCALQGGFTIGQTKDACAQLIQHVKCPKGRIYYAGFCYYKFNVETELRFFVIESDAETACQSLDPLSHATTRLNIYLKSWLQKKFVFWKRQTAGFPYRITIKGKSCLGFDFKENVGEDSENVYEMSCEEPAFPLCRSAAHEVDIPHSAILMDALVVNVFKNGQEGVPRVGLPMECECSSGWCSDSCETACCSISQTIGNDSLTNFLQLCTQRNRGSCDNGNPRFCKCYEGFGPSVDWLVDPGAKIVCACPTTAADRLHFSTDYLVNDVRYNVTVNSNSICGGSSRGKCVVEESINEGLCECSARTDMNPDTPAERKQRAGYDGMSCTNPLPIVPSDGYNVNGPLIERICTGRGTGCPNGERYDEQQLNEIYGTLYGRKECREINGDLKYGCSCDPGYGGQGCTCPLAPNLLNSKVYFLPDEKQGIFSFLKRKSVIRFVTVEGPCVPIYVELLLADATVVECDIDDPVLQKYQCDSKGKQASQVNVHVEKLSNDNLVCLIKGFDNNLPVCGLNPNPYSARFFSNEVKRSYDFHHDPQLSSEGPYGCTITECMYNPGASGKYGRTGISGYRLDPNGDNVVVEYCGMSTNPPRGYIDEDGNCVCYPIDGPFVARYKDFGCEGEESLIKGEWKECHGRGLSARPKFPYGDCSFDLRDREADPLIHPGIGTSQSTFNRSYVYTVTSNSSVIYMNGGYWRFSQDQKLVIDGLYLTGEFTEVVLENLPNQALPVNVTYICDKELLTEKVSGVSTVLTVVLGGGIVVSEEEHSFLVPMCNSELGNGVVGHKCRNETVWTNTGEYDNEETLETGVYEGCVLLTGSYSGESSTDVQLSYGVFDCSKAIDRILNDVAFELGYVTAKQCQNVTIVSHSNVNGAGYGLWWKYIPGLAPFDTEQWTDDHYLLVSNLLGGIVALDAYGRIDELAFTEKTWDEITKTWFDDVTIETTSTFNVSGIPLAKTLVDFNLDWNYQGLFGNPFAHRQYYLFSNFSLSTWNFRPVYSMNVPTETEYMSAFSVRIPSDKIDCLQVYTSKGTLCGMWCDLVANSTLRVDCNGLFVTEEDAVDTIIERFTVDINNVTISNVVESNYLALRPIIQIRIAWSSSVDINFTLSDFTIYGRDEPYRSLFSELKRKIEEEFVFPNNTVYLDGMKGGNYRSLDLGSYTDRDYLKRLWYTHLAPRKCSNDWQCKTFARAGDTYSCVFDSEYVEDWTAHGSESVAVIGDEGGCKCNSTLFDPTFFCAYCVHGYGPNDFEGLWEYNRYTNSTASDLCTLPWLEGSTKRNKVCGGRGLVVEERSTFVDEIHVFENNVTRRCTAVEDSDGTRWNLTTSEDYDVDVMTYGSDWFIVGDKVFFEGVEKVVVSLKSDDVMLFTDGSTLECIPLGYSPIYRTTVLYREETAIGRRRLVGVTNEHIVVEFVDSRYSFWKTRMVTKITDRDGDEPLPPPTKAPTGYPSSSPSSAPSLSPVTSFPTLSPTTSNPSKSPTTSNPSKSPSKSPSQSPKTSGPSSSPSRAPSNSPRTTAPSLSPSRAPSKSPITSTPSSSPSKAPSSSPKTTSPSKSPSKGPLTSTPSKSPSKSPSGSPKTTKPSYAPSKSPSSSPFTTSPSLNPSLSPSSSPFTTSPSLNPSLPPTLKPTFAPTKTPTLAPTNEPTTRTPTRTPTTAAPTFAPSNNLGTCTATGTMITARGHLAPAAHLLPNGKVLIAGGTSGSASVLCELYTIGSGTWASTGSMSVARHGSNQNQYTISLPNGNVLVIPGSDLSNVIEVYDWLLGTWSRGPILPSTYHGQQPVVLVNGQVLITGGVITGGADTAHCFLYDPTLNTLIQTGSLPLASYAHTAVALQDGNAIVIGGIRATASVSTTYLYTTSTGVWSIVGSLPATAHYTQSRLLNDGTVLTCGGYRNAGAVTLSSCFVYTPTTQIWVTVGSMNSARNVFNMVLLPNGEVQAIAGYNGAAGVSSTEVYTPSLRTWRVGASISSVRWHHSSVYLGNSNFLVFGGYNGAWTSTADLCTIPFTPAPAGSPVLTTSVPTFAPTGAPTIAGTCVLVASMASARNGNNGNNVLLGDGRVLVAGGANLASCEIYNPVTNTWRTVGSMSISRDSASSTKTIHYVPSIDRVIAFPGDTPSSALIEKFNPTTETWSTVNSFPSALTPQVNLMLNGNFLIAGSAAETVNCFIYYPVTNALEATGSLPIALGLGGMANLLDGNVIYVGGRNGGGSAYRATTYLYNVTSRVWITVGSMSWSALYPQLETLPNGRVIACGGYNNNLSPPSAIFCDIFNPSTLTWSSTQSLSVPRNTHKSITLTTGEKVFVAGYTGSAALSSNDVYNPTTGFFRAGPTLNTARFYVGAVALNNGRFLVIGGLNSASAVINTVEMCTLIGTASPPTVTPTAATTIAPTSAPTITAACTTAPTTPNMGTARRYNAGLMVLLGNGRILVVGGSDLTTCELYNIATNTWSSTGSVAVSTRNTYTHTILLYYIASINRAILFTGTGTASALIQSYDPIAGTWSSVISFAIAYQNQAIVLLSNGIFLLAGGNAGITTCFLYNPVLNILTTTGALPGNKIGGSLANLPNGNAIYIAGTTDASTFSAVCYLYNVALGTWSTTGSILYGYNPQGVPQLLSNGLVLACGGWTGAAGVATCNLYNYLTGVWSNTAPMSAGRHTFTMVTLSNGEIHALGGYAAGGTAMTSTEIYNVTSGTWRAGPSFTAGRYYHASISLGVNQVFTVGGSTTGDGAARNTVEYCSFGSSTTQTPTVALTLTPTMAPTTTGSCVYTVGNMNSARTFLNGVAQLLNNGQTLMCGGSTTTGGSGLTSCELYNPITGLFTVTGSMSTGRKTVAVPEDSFVKLLDGRVFAIPVSTQSTVCEVYDPATGLWSLTASLPVSQFRMNMILLANGNVLIVGGLSPSEISACYLYDPVGNTMRTTGSLPDVRTNNKLILLQNGNVLSMGGYRPAFGQTSVYLYSTTLETWSTVAAFTGSRWGVEAVVLLNGNVLMCGGYENTNDCLIYHPTLNVWANTGQPTHAFGIGHQMVLMTNGEVVTSGANGGSVFIQVYGLGGIWRVGPSMAVARYFHSVVMLSSTQILVMGGNTGGGSVHNTAEICTVSLAPSPITRSPTVTFTIAPTIAPTSSGPSCVATASMANVRASTSSNAILLNDGRVLVCGGATTAHDGTATATCEIFTPGGRWTPTGSMFVARKMDSSILYRCFVKLADGRVLATPADTYSSVLEVYDPVTGIWSLVAPLPIATIKHMQSVLLTNGMVLIAGGNLGGTTTALCYLYNPILNTLSPTGSIPTITVYSHELIALQNGNAILFGGYSSTLGAASSSTFLYNNNTGVWSTVGSLSAAWQRPIGVLMPSGNVLMCGGDQNTISTQCQMYITSTGVWSIAGSLIGARYLHRMVVLPNGEVQVFGGLNTGTVVGGTVLTTEIRSTLGVWRSGPSMTTQRVGHSVVVLSNGQVLVIGGTNAANTPQSSAEICTNAFQQLPAETFTPTVPGLTFSPTSTSPTPAPVAACTAGASMSTARGDFAFSLVLLSNGNVLAIGGSNGAGTALATTEIYDPLLNTWTAAGSMTNTRVSFFPRNIVTTSTGLIYAGQYGANGPQIYHQNFGLWTATATMPASYLYQEATALDNGRVLLSGGQTAGVRTANCFLFDPVLNTVTATGSLPITLDAHSTIKLQNGNVLTAGGYTTTGGNADTLNCYLYNTVAGTWSLTGTLPFARRYPISILLNSGRVLLTGGYGDAQSPTAVNNCNIYDPATGIWSTTGSMITRRYLHSLVLLPNGNVMAFAGNNGANFLATEIYNVNTGIWSVAASLVTVSAQFSAVYIPSINKILVAGGVNTAWTRISSTELCNYP